MTFCHLAMFLGYFPGMCGALTLVQYFLKNKDISPKVLPLTFILKQLQIGVIFYNFIHNLRISSVVKYLSRSR